MRSRSSALPSERPTRPGGTSTRVCQSPLESRSTDFSTLASGSAMRQRNRQADTAVTTTTSPRANIGQYWFRNAAMVPWRPQRKPSSYRA